MASSCGGGSMSSGKGGSRGMRGSFAPRLGRNGSAVVTAGRRTGAKMAKSNSVVRKSGSRGATKVTKASGMKSGSLRATRTAPNILNVSNGPFA